MASKAISQLTAYSNVSEVVRGVDYLEILGTSETNNYKILISEFFELEDNLKIVLGTGSDAEIYVSSADDLYITQLTSNKDTIFTVNDGGVSTEVLRFDGSEGKAVMGSVTALNGYLGIKGKATTGLDYLLTLSGSASGDTLNIAYDEDNDNHVFRASGNNRPVAFNAGSNEIFRYGGSGVRIADDYNLEFGTGSDIFFEYTSASNRLLINSDTADADIRIVLNNGGVDYEAMYFDGSEGKVAINTSTVGDGYLTIKGQATSGLDYLQTWAGTTAGDVLNLAYDEDNNLHMFRISGTARPLVFNWGTTEIFRIASASLASFSQKVYIADYLGVGDSTPTRNITSAEDVTLTQSETTLLPAAIRIDPTLTVTDGGSYTVTRQSYFEIANTTKVETSGTITITDGCVFTFPQAAGTHIAVDSGSTKTSPGTVTAWIKHAIGGVVHYVPAYSSKTS